MSTCKNLPLARRREAMDNLRRRPGCEERGLTRSAFPHREKSHFVQAFPNPVTPSSPPRKHNWHIICPDCRYCVRARGKGGVARCGEPCGGKFVTCPASASYKLAATISSGRPPQSFLFSPDDSEEKIMNARPPAGR